MPNRTENYDYSLPQELIAQTPLGDRSASRLLVIDRSTEKISHHSFQDILDFVRPGDVWVFNNTAVFPARIFLRKSTGANIEFLFLERDAAAPSVWSALARPGKRLKPGNELFLPDGSIICTVREKSDDGRVNVELAPGVDIFEVLEKHGVVPLPPYIHEKLENGERYQTVYAGEKGSSAAPTAGLHFTGEILNRLAESAEVRFVTLHIGLDTFRPISADDLSRHIMHSEHVFIPAGTAAAVAAAKAEGRRVVAVGTTSVRSLESWAARQATDAPLLPQADSFRTDIFIRPGHTFKVVDALLTNFHLPRSTLLVLVSALAGRELILNAYSEAVAMRYRFFSFGDAMLII